MYLFRVLRLKLRSVHGLLMGSVTAITIKGILAISEQFAIKNPRGIIADIHKPSSILFFFFF